MGPRTPRYHGPPGVSPQKQQGGPWAPPPCCVTSFENWQVFAFGSLSGILGIYVGFSVRCFSPGKVYCLVLCPLRPDPCQKYCLLSSLSLSLSISLFVCLVGSSATLALFLSLSGAGETQTPFVVWVSPCVSSSWPRTPSFDPYILGPTTTPRSFHHAPVFFFVFPSSLVFPVGMFLDWCGWVGFLGGWVSWWLVVCWCVLACNGRC